MKIKDFKTGSSTGSMDEIQHRLGRNSEIKFVNALKETEYQTTIDNLTKKAIKLDSVTANLKTVSVQKQEAIQAKHAAESKLEALISSFELNKNSLKQYEDREPRIKNIIEQHRELNGEVADLQSKLQMVVEQHDQKVDIINDNIKTINTLEDSLHSSETSSAKAHQAKLEAVVEKDEIKKQFLEATEKIRDLGIIDREGRGKLADSEETVRQLRFQLSDNVRKKEEALSLAQKSQTLGDKLSQENRRTQAESSQINKKNKKLEDDVIEMTSIIKTLQEDISFISEQNKEMFEELAKPRFASIAAINNKEGFKFPTSFEPRGNSLGMGKPTLLRKKG
jgi:DNA repair exonuclease SbcCD ATPase subunit